jgi:hypothetical protein
MSASRSQPSPTSVPSPVTTSVPSAAEVLAKAADLIEPAGAWCRDWTARRLNDRDPTISEATLSADPRAIQWGGLGAIYKIGLDAGLTNAQCWAALEFAARAVETDRFTRWAWDPRRTQAEVVAALRKAAEIATADTSEAHVEVPGRDQ